MATFTYDIARTQKRADGTRNVKIRVTHNRKVARIPTQIYAKDSDLAIGKKGTVIKNQIMLTQVNQILDNYRVKANELSSITQSVEELVSILTSKDDMIDFFSFGRSYVEANKKKHPGTMKNYTYAINSLIKYLSTNSGSTIKRLNILDINYQFLTKYVAFMDKNRKGDSNRAVCLYLACIRHLHKEARFTYNKPEQGKILIPFNPFEFFKIPAETSVENRTVTPETIRQIYNLGYVMNKMTREDKAHRVKRESEKECRFNLAKDMFILSFCLIGMNSSDLYTCTKMEGGVITYNRDKTKSRRTDKAKMKVVIPDMIKDLVEKYKDPSGQRVFRFHKLYSSAACFNAAINKGLKQIGEKLQLDDLEYYAARHSWATIARNDVRIDKYTVHQCLNHMDKDMKVTDRYIDRTFAIENEANEKVIKFVFG